MNIMMLLEMAQGAFPDRRAFTHEGESLSYQDLFDASGCAAARIGTSGRTHAAVLDVTSLATPIALFGSAWAGAPYVPLNYRLTDDEISALLGRIVPTCLVTEDGRETAFNNNADITVESRSQFLALSRKADQTADPWSMDPEDTAVLLFTSGTTGEPKAAVLRQKHLVSYILTSVEFMSADEDEAALVCVPPYHIAGIAAILSSVYSGRRIVQLSNFSADKWIRLARQERITTAFVVPTMLARIIKELDGENHADMPHLASLSYGGGKMPLPVLERAMALFPDTDFTNAYGLTETSSTISVLGPDEHRAAANSDDELVRRRLVSVGQALPGVEIEIRDDNGQPLPADVSGEIFVRGEQVSGEYEGVGKLTDEEGWFPTRDNGSLDAEGYLFLEGRADDVIVRGGENLSPGEIEDVLIQHDAVEDVAIVGVPDEQWGEAIAATIVLKPGHSATADELKAWVNDQMRSSRVPQHIHFWDEIPYNPTGKLLRRMVKAQLLQSD